MEDTFHLGVKALIKNVRGEILLLKANTSKFKKQEKSYWDLPGGRVQKGDSVQQTLLREIKEETGIETLANIQEVGMYLSTKRISVDENDFGLILWVFECKIEEGFDILLSDEHTEYKWFSPREASKVLKKKYPHNFTKRISGM